MSVQKGELKTSDGAATIAYRVHGSDQKGVPLVMFNGMSAIMEDWSPLVEELAKTRKVLIFDHRGIGSSTVSEDWDHELTHSIMALDALEVVRKLGWSEVDVAGFSMGGQIVQVLLSHDQGETTSAGKRALKGVTFRKAILASTMTKLPHGDFQPQMLEEEAAKYPNREEANRKVTEMLMTLQYDDAWIAADPAHRKKWEQRVELALNTRRPQSIVGLQIMAISQVDTRKQLGRIPATLPVAVIHGRKDRMVHYGESEYILEHISHARRLLAPGGDEFGHFWFEYFKIEDWAKTINAFLDADEGSNSGRSAGL